MATNLKKRGKRARVRMTENDCRHNARVVPAIRASVASVSFAVIARILLRWSHKHETPVELRAIVWPLQHDIHRLKCAASSTPVPYNENRADNQFFDPYGIAAKRCAKCFGFREREACMKLGRDVSKFSRFNVN